MGQGSTYKCKKCGHEYGINPGVGMRYPSVCKRIRERISAGDYGSEWKDAYESAGRYVAVCAENEVFICDNCGKWEQHEDITLYVPDNEAEAGEMTFGDSTVKELGEVPYLMDPEDEGFHVHKPYRPPCPECGSAMRPAKMEELYELPCPKCGERNELDGIIMWD